MDTACQRSRATSGRIRSASKYTKDTFCWAFCIKPVWFGKKTDVHLQVRGFAEATVYPRSCMLQKGVGLRRTSFVEREYVYIYIFHQF